MLLLKIPGIPQERYIREGRNKEFEPICEEIEKLDLRDRRNLVIEVTRVGSL